MKIKKISILLIFVFSLILANLYASHSRPPLLEAKNTQNIVMLADNNSNAQEIISFDLGSRDVNGFIVEHSRELSLDVVTISVGIIAIFLLKEKVFRGREKRGLFGIVFWNRRRILRI